MVNHHATQLACRTKLLTLSVVTSTGTFSATATGYARTTGSFITDGFRPGMEVAGTSFTVSANNTAKTITAVTTLTITASGCAVEAADTRTLSVGLPSRRAWENVAFTPTDGAPYVEENYLPGPMSKQTLGSFAQLEVLPQFVIKIFTPANMGMDAARKYADALLTLFAPGTALTAGSDTVRVRSDVAPFTGQLLQSAPGFAVLPLTVPLRIWTANSI